MMNRYKPVGWRNESWRHSLAAKGIKTIQNKYSYVKDYESKQNISPNKLFFWNEIIEDVANKKKEEILSGNKLKVKLLKTNKGVVVADGSHALYAYLTLDMIPIFEFVENKGLKKSIEAGEVPLERVSDVCEMEV